MSKKLFFNLVLVIVCSRFSFSQSIFQLTNHASSVHRLVSMSQDGSRVFYLRTTSLLTSSEPGTLYVREAGATVPRVLAENVRADWLFSNSDGSQLLFGFHVDGSDPGAGWSEIQSLDVHTKRVFQVVGPSVLRVASQVALAAKSKKILFTSDRGLYGIVSVSFSGQIELVALAYGPLMATNPTGRVLYYESGGIWRVDIGGGLPEKLITYNLNVNSIHRVYPTPDGNFIFLSRRYGASSFRYSRATGKIEPLIEDTYAHVHALSGDGKWLVVASTANLTGENPDRSAELFLISADGLVPAKQLTHVDATGITPQDCDDPVWLSADGSVILTLSVYRLPGPDARIDRPASEWLYRIVHSEAWFQPLDFASRQRNHTPVALDQGHFVFGSSGAPTSSSDLLVARFDGSDFRQLTQLDLPYYFGAASSNHAEVLALLRGTFEPGNMVVQTLVAYHTDSHQEVEVATVRFPAPLPHDFTWRGLFGMSLDGCGKNLAFSSFEKLRPQDPSLGHYLYLARLTGDRPQLSLLGFGLLPVFSSDGQLIAFNRGPKLFVIRPDGSGLREIGRGSDPYLSADGKWIVFTRDDRLIQGRTDSVFERELGGPLHFRSARISADARVIVGLEGRSSSSTSRFFAGYDQDGREIARVLFPQPIPVYSWSLDRSGTQAYFSTPAKIRENSDGSEEIFAARLIPFRYWISEIDNATDDFNGVALANLNSDGAQLSFVARDRNGNAVSSANLQQTVPRTLAPSQQFAALLSEVFQSQLGIHTAEISSDTGLASFFLSGSSSLDRLAGSSPREQQSSRKFFPIGSLSGVTATLSLINTNAEAVWANVGENTSPFSRSRQLRIAPFGTATLEINEWLVRPSSATQALLEVFSSLPISAQLRLEQTTGRRSTTSISPLEAVMASESLVFPHVLVGGGYETRVWVANPGASPVEIEIELWNSSGELLRVPEPRVIGSLKTLDLKLNDLFDSDRLTVGYVRLRTLSAGTRVSGVAVVSASRGASLFSVEAVKPLSPRVVFPHVAQNQVFFTGYSVVNPYDFPIQYRVDVFDQQGTKRSSLLSWAGAREKHSQLLSRALQQDHAGGYFVIETDWPVSVIALIGTTSGSALANLPAQ